MQIDYLNVGNTEGFKKGPYNFMKLVYWPTARVPIRSRIMLRADCLYVQPAMEPIEITLNNALFNIYQIPH